MESYTVKFQVGEILLRQAARLRCSPSSMALDDGALRCWRWVVDVVVVGCLLLVVDEALLAWLNLRGGHNLGILVTRQSS